MIDITKFSGPSWYSIAYRHLTSRMSELLRPYTPALVPHHPDQFLNEKLKYKVIVYLIVPPFFVLGPVSFDLKLFFGIQKAINHLLLVLSHMGSKMGRSGLGLKGLVYAMAVWRANPKSSSSLKEYLDMKFKN